MTIAGQRIRELNHPYAITASGNATRRKRQDLPGGEQALLRSQGIEAGVPQTVPHKRLVNERVAHDLVDDELDGELDGDRPRDGTSLLGLLASTIAHLAILLLAAALFSDSTPDSALEIQFGFSPVAAESLDTLTMEWAPEIPDPDDRQTDASDVASQDMEIVEPTLAMEVADLGAKQVDQPRSQGANENGLTGRDNAAGKAGPRVEFFGAAAYGNRFVFVVDISGSMGRKSLHGLSQNQLATVDARAPVGRRSGVSRRFSPRASRTAFQDNWKARLAAQREWHDNQGDSRFAVASNELLRSVGELKPEQEFCVILFSSGSQGTKLMSEQEEMQLVRASKHERERLKDWITLVRPGGGTDPREALMLAFQQKPDAVFLLSDGQFGGSRNEVGFPADTSVEDIVTEYRQGGTPLHTIAFEDTHNRGRLRRLSESTNGVHRFVGLQSEQSLLQQDLRSIHKDDVRYSLQMIIDGRFAFSPGEKIRLGLQCSTLLRGYTPPLQRMAHESLVTLANGIDLGPAEDDDYPEILAAARRWRQHWSQVIAE